MRSRQILAIFCSTRVGVGPRQEPESPIVPEGAARARNASHPGGEPGGPKKEARALACHAWRVDQLRGEEKLQEAAYATLGRGDQGAKERF